MTPPQSSLIDQSLIDQSVDSNRQRKQRWGKVLFVALTVCSAFVLFLSGWSTLSAHNAFQPTVPTLPPPNVLVNDVAAGDVDQDSAILWARSNTASVVTFTYGVNLTTTVTLTREVVDPAIPVTVTLSGLLSDTQYLYRVFSPLTIGLTGTFRTAAGSAEPTGLRFGASGDWRGDLAPYISVRNAFTHELDFFVALGNTIFADLPSPSVPLTQATTLSDYRAKHSEVYSDKLALNTLGDLRRSTALFATINDHEVINDFAGGMNASLDARFAMTSGLVNDAPLYEAGLQAFQDYNPLATEFYGTVGGDGRMDNERKLYRYRTFGRDAALFVLDTRSFRDAPIAPLSPAQYSNPFAIAAFLGQTFTAGRTLLGSQQLADLKTDLLDAQTQGITWKFVALPAPIQNLGPLDAQDRFEGYAAERTELLKYIVDNGIENVVFVAADIHGTVVNNLTYQNSAGGTQQSTGAFEITTGAVAFDAPFGPTTAALAVQAGLIPTTTQQLYATLPISNDLDSVINDKDDLLKSFSNQVLTTLGYDPVGLDNSPIQATLLQGDYMAVHTYGWTEFEIAADTQSLTVTTYGSDAYTASQLTNDPSSVTSLTPQVVSQFRVTPVGFVASGVYLPIIAK